MAKLRKTVVITGGGSGIGAATAKILYQHDYRVVLVGKEREGLQATQKELGSDPDRVSIFECDLSKAKDTIVTAEKIASSFKGIYGLINNAGIYPFGGLSTTDLQSWDDCLATNLRSAFLLAKSLAPEMAKNGGGRIVNISSTAGLLPNHFALAYSVSKAGLIQLTKTLAKELGPQGITVNCICPGIVRSPLHKAYHRNDRDLEAFYGKRGSAYPMGRVGNPEDVAHIINFFLEENTSWVTGDVMVADGGRLLT